MLGSTEKILRKDPPLGPALLPSPLSQDRCLEASWCDLVVTRYPLKDHAFWNQKRTTMDPFQGVIQQGLPEVPSSLRCGGLLAITSSLHPDLVAGSSGTLQVPASPGISTFQLDMQGLGRTKEQHGSQACLTGILILHGHPASLTVCPT